ncbi:MAG: MgtC/SapB family protein [Patescibacteria group bacterium]
MLTFLQMATRLLIALILGGVMGLEREILGKEAGVRTAMLVSSGSAIFTMISLMVPYVADPSSTPSDWNTIPDRVLANIVVGIGFLGAGIILKTGERVRGLTTAAVIWAVAAVGSLVGMGLIKLAIFSAITLSGALFITRKIGLYEWLRPDKRQESGRFSSLDD